MWGSISLSFIIYIFRLFLLSNSTYIALQARIQKDTFSRDILASFHVHCINGEEKSFVRNDLRSSTGHQTAPAGARHWESWRRNLPNKSTRDSRYHETPHKETRHTVAVSPTTRSCRRHKRNNTFKLLKSLAIWVCEEFVPRERKDGDCGTWVWSGQLVMSERVIARKFIALQT